MTRHWRCAILLLVLLEASLAGQAQQSRNTKEGDRVPDLRNISSPYDRATGTHNRSNIGMCFENRGRLYPRRTTPGTPAGEFPLGSGMHYIYHINPLVGIPGNVIQGRWIENVEWEAASGYHNRDSATVATSDRPVTWPASGWPVRDASGSPRFVSDQDTYCVYNDSTNTKGILDIQVNQTGYAFGAEYAKNMVFFTYQLVNRSSRTFDSLYFGLYLDIDVGNVDGGVAEYADDKMGFDGQLRLVYFYDDGYTPEWPGNQTGYFGVTVVSTPSPGGVERGITDLHYNLFEHDIDIDTVQYGIMASVESLYASALGTRFFHLGANAPNLHFDDPTTIPESGLDIVVTLSSGPYVSLPGDTLTFVTAVVAGWNYEEIKQSAQVARDLASGGYVSVGKGDEAGVLSASALDQNYPNPFNSSTVIRYSLPRRAHVRLAVYDLLGRPVTVLVEGEEESGRHQVAFDAKGLASGTYICQLRAAGIVQTRRMSILR